MSSFRPNPEDIGPDGYLKDTPDANKFKEKVTEFNKNLYSKEAKEERGDIIDYNTVKIEDGTVGVDTPKVVTAGFMGLPTMAWIAIGGVALYYAYSKGMLKKLIK